MNVEQLEYNRIVDLTHSFVNPNQVLSEEIVALRNKLTPLPPSGDWRWLGSFPEFVLTPERAKQMQTDYNLFLGQRNATKKRKEMIATAGLTDNWHGNKFVLAILGEEYEAVDGRNVNALLLNGGNSIAASIEYGLTLKHNLLQVIYCPTIKSAANVYHNMDRKESTRTASEQSKAVLAGEENRSDWSSQSGIMRPGVFKDCFTAACVVEYGPNYRSKGMSTIEKVAMAQDRYSEEMDWLRGFVFDRTIGSPARSVAKQYKSVVGVLAPMMYTHIVWGNIAEEFWDDVIKGYRNTPNNRLSGVAIRRTPQDALLNYLNNCKDTEVLKYEKVMAAANAWASGHTTFSYKGRANFDREPIPMEKFRPHPSCRPTAEEWEDK